MADSTHKEKEKSENHYDKKAPTDETEGRKSEIPSSRSAENPHKEDDKDDHDEKAVSTDRIKKKRAGGRKPKVSTIEKQGEEETGDKKRKERQREETKTSNQTREEVGIEMKKTKKMQGEQATPKPPSRKR